MRAKALFVFLVAIVVSAGVALGQTEWVDHPDNPIYEGSYLSAVVFDGTTYHMWASPDLTNIDHATSPDGVTWTEDPANPVLTPGASGDWDDFALLAAAVIHDGSQFRMWYDGMGDVDFKERTGYATSPDGTVWTKYENNPVMDVGPPGSWDDTVAVPTSVVVDGGTHKMWYMGFDQNWGNGATSAIGYAESADGIAWTKYGDPVFEGSGIPGSWDEDFVLDPFVILNEGTYHMWYGGGGNISNWGEMSIGYAFSSDGVSWTRHRFNPVVEIDGIQVSIANVRLNGSNWQMWFAYYDQDTNFIGYSTSDCCAGVPDMDQMLFIPAAAVASGAQGAFYQTDVDVSNADDQSVEYEFSWLPRAEDNSERATSETFSLGAGKSIRYANILSEVFDLEPDSLGALAILSTSSDLIAMSRTYNLPGEKVGGTYGQAMPAMSTDEFIRGTTKRILFGSENADMRTNVGCQNGTDSTTVVYLDLFAADGTSLGRETMMLRALGNDQVNRIFDGHNPMNGYVDVTPAQADKPVYCYGSVLDNVTSDPTTIPPQ